MMAATGGTVVWMFGRGLSIGCGLAWDVPASWKALPRDEQIQRIKVALANEMTSPSINASGIRDLLSHLENHTVPNWRHLFVTTNWDYLLQREISTLGLKVQPPWLANSHVFHLNGTVENLPNNENRSPFLLVEDGADQRTNTVEANIVFNQMIWYQTFVVVGMSFECDTDKFLLHALSRVEDDLPIGESQWTLVNPDQAVLDSVRARIQTALPRARIECVCATLDTWRDERFPSLLGKGVFSS